MKRIYHPYHSWEDWQAGLYRSVPHQLFGDLETEAAILLADPVGLEMRMRCVTLEWVNSSEVVFTNPSRNHRAWLGQAACCHHSTAPEYATKSAWRTLTEDQQRVANNVADMVIADWRSRVPQ